MKLLVPMSLHEACVECLGWFEALRRLGFPTMEIVFVIYNDGVGLQVQSQGKSANIVEIAVQRMPAPNVSATAWSEIRARWLGAPQTGQLGLSAAERHQVFRNSWPYHHAAQLAMGLTALGFVFHGEVAAATMRPAHA